MKITPHLFEAFLKCPTKCWLRATGEPASGNTYAEWVKEQSETYSAAETERLLTQTPPSEHALSPPAENLKAAKWRIEVDAVAQASAPAGCGSVSLPGRAPGETPGQLADATSALPPQAEPPLLETRLHAIERVPSEGRGKAARFIPIRFIFRNKLTKDDKLLVAFDAFVLSEMLGREVSVATIIHGDDHATLKVKASALAGEVRKRLEKIAALLSSPAPPDLILNRHCAECEFQIRCRQKALEKDDLSLLAGMSEKERKKLHSKGIFTVTQLSYTFRPRRQVNKRLKNRAQPHYFSLQALAIKENRAYIYGSRDFPTSRTQIYLDIEGLPDSNAYYLIGALIVSDGQETFYSFWADTEEDEVSIFSQFLQTASRMQDRCVYHFGDYEQVALRRTKSRLPPHLQQITDALLAECFNVLPLLRSRVYLPVYSNDLKTIGHYLDQAWTHPSSSGLQSIVWRTTWETTHTDVLKSTLLQYNRDDCGALRTLVTFLQRLPDADAPRTPPGSGQSVRFADDAANEDWSPFQKAKVALEGYDDIVHAAYFTYQRRSIYVRTHPKLRRINKRADKRNSITLRPNAKVELSARKCPYCGSYNLARGTYYAKRLSDLRMSSGGIKRWVTQYVCQRHECLDCAKTFLPVTYRRKKPFGRTLMLWAMQQHVCNRVTYDHISTTARDCFGLEVTLQSIHRFKATLATYYRITCRRLFDRLLHGDLLHVDETKVNLKQESGYVWVFTSMEEVVYMYRSNRKAEFLKALLRGFSGVVVTDFYSGYDSLECAQQKCLIHLIRDINDDLLKHPFDEELAKISRGFGKLLREIIGTIDKRGLKKRWLLRHKEEVEKYFEAVSRDRTSSEAADSLKKRLIKSQSKLFTFLDYNGIPWNNNNAEHAIKPFAKYRTLVNGRITKTGLEDYLVLLSIQQTCEYKGVSFLQFLRSEKRDVDEFCEPV